jgi:roadblock/LC7 domain-containing protein
MIGRSGLTDNVNSKDIVKRIKDSTEQMKLIMNIANMPEMKDAIEQLSKLQKMGANVTGGVYSDASSTMRQLGGMASVAGTSVQKLMNTVGAQGQYLYQANGMTPHLGQMAAANSYAALSSGNRQGLISSAQMARMGGLDGATQASLTGELNASQTTYNKIANYNTQFGGGNGGSALGNLQKFGQAMSRNPMGASGAMSLYGNIMGGNQMAARGSLALDDQVWDMLKNMPGMVDSKTGKIALEKAVPYLNNMGMSNDQIMAYASKRVSETDMGSYQASVKGIGRNHMEQQKQMVEQNTLYAGVIGRTVHSMMKGGRELTAEAGDVFGGGPASAVGKASDAISGAWNHAWFNDTIKSNGMTVDEALSGQTSSSEVQGFKINTLFDNYQSKGDTYMKRKADGDKYGRTKGT